MNYVLGTLLWKLPRAPQRFNPAVQHRNFADISSHYFRAQIKNIISRQTIRPTIRQSATAMKTITITWPLQSRLLNSTLLIS